MNTRATPLICLVLLSLGIAGCTSESEPGTGKSHHQHIVRIDQALISRVVIENEENIPMTIEQRMDELKIPGLSIAFIDGGEIAWTQNYGFADKENMLPVSDETLFQAASISKAVSATAALDLVEEGLLDLDSDINLRLVGWQLPTHETGIPVTLRGLLTHSAGLNVQGFPGYGPGEEIPSAVDVLEGKGNTPSVEVDLPPRTAYRYSGGGYTVIQQAVIDATGKSYEDVLRSRVLEPLKMDRSTFEQPLPAALHSIAATGYRSDGSPVEGRFHTYPEKAAAGLWTTPTELAKWAIAIQTGLAEGNHPFLDAETVSHMVMIDSISGIGLGLGLPHEGAYFSHGGANEGFRCNLTAQVKGTQGLVVMTNSDRGNVLAYEILLTVANAYGWDGYEPLRKRTVALPVEHLDRLVGHYRSIDRPELVVEIRTSDRGLTGIRLWDNGQIPLAAESETRFFDRRDGTLLTFELGEKSFGQAEALEASGLRFEREEK